MIENRIKSQIDPELILNADDDDGFGEIMDVIFEKINPKIKIRRVMDGEELMDYLARRNSYQSQKVHPDPP